MSERARLGMMAAAPALVRLRITAQAFSRARRLQLRLAGSEVATWSIEVTRAQVETPEFAIPAGFSFLELVSLDGTTSAGADPRRLSIALYDAELLRSPAR